jgi:hypothetical protein
VLANWKIATLMFWITVAIHLRECGFGRVWKFSALGDGFCIALPDWDILNRTRSQEQDARPRVLAPGILFVFRSERSDVFCLKAFRPLGDVELDPSGLLAGCESRLPEWPKNARKHRRQTGG